MPAWGGAERLAQVVGRSRAMLAITTGELYDAPDRAAARASSTSWSPARTFDDEWRALARRMAATAPGTTRAVKAVIGAAVPTLHPELEADATDDVRAAVDGGGALGRRRGAGEQRRTAMNRR